MFEVLVLVCLASNPNDCFQIEDTRGPYETKSKCIERSIEMREAINKIPDHVPKGYKCLKNHNHWIGADPVKVA